MLSLVLNLFLPIQSFSNDKRVRPELAQIGAFFHVNKCMSKYKFIKTKTEIAIELHRLWDNYPLYKFINGAQWIRKRELEIAECLIDRIDWIELCRIVWFEREQQKPPNKKKP